MPRLPVEVMLATSFDDKFPAQNILANDAKFFLTTGMYPQEILMAFKDESVVNLGRIDLSCHGIKKIRVEKCTERFPTNFEPIVECELPDTKTALQQEAFQINKNTAGANVRYVKLVLLEGTQQFAMIQHVNMDGDVMGGGRGGDDA